MSDICDPACRKEICDLACECECSFCRAIRRDRDRRAEECMTKEIHP